MGKLIDVWITGAFAMLLGMIIVQFLIIVIDTIEMCSSKPIGYGTILLAISIPLIIGGLIYMYQLSYKLLSKML